LHAEISGSRQLTTRGRTGQHELLLVHVRVDRIADPVPTIDSAWLDGLRNHGWIDERNLIIEYRYAPSQDRLPALAAELIALSADLLIATNPQTAVALKSATASDRPPLGGPSGMLV
jgi:hypothetical protein